MEEIRNVWEMYVFWNSWNGRGWKSSHGVRDEVAPGGWEGESLNSIESAVCKPPSIDPSFLVTDDENAVYLKSNVMGS